MLSNFSTWQIYVNLLNFQTCVKCNFSQSYVWAHQVKSSVFWVVFLKNRMRSIFACCCSVVCCSAAPWTAAHPASLSFTVSLICSNSCLLSQWYHPTVSSSVTSFSSCPQSLPPSGSFPVSWLFSFGGQSIGTSASVFPVNIQGWFPLGLTGWISAVHGILKSRLLHHSSKVSILWRSAFMV